MAKSAISRHHNERLYNKAAKELKQFKMYDRLNIISYGRVFKQDIWDCGISNCKHCHPHKVWEPKKFRLESRNLERSFSKKELD